MVDYSAKIIARTVAVHLKQRIVQPFHITDTKPDAIGAVNLLHSSVQPFPQHPWCTLRVPLAAFRRLRNQLPIATGG